MLKRIVVLSVVLFLSQGVVSASFPDLSKMGLPQTAGASLADLMNSKNKLVGTFLQYNQGIASALAKIAEILGAKAEAPAPLKSIHALQPNAITDSALKTSGQGIASVAGLLTQKLQAAPDLSAHAKTSFVDSVGSLANGVTQLINMAPQLGELTAKAQGALLTAPAQDKPKMEGVLSTAMALAKNIPTDLNSYKALLSSLTQYASAHNIKLPETVTSLAR
jgi:hypothetical protein